MIYIILRPAWCNISRRAYSSDRGWCCPRVEFRILNGTFHITRLCLCLCSHRLKTSFPAFRPTPVVRKLWVPNPKEVLDNCWHKLKKSYTSNLGIFDRKNLRTTGLQARLILYDTRRTRPSQPLQSTRGLAK